MYECLLYLSVTIDCNNFVLVPLINKFKDDGVKRLKSVYSNLITWNNENERCSIRVAMRNNKNDNDYIIHSISGLNFYSDNIDECYIQVDKVSKEISLMFKNVEKVVEEKNHVADPSGQSKSKGVYFWFGSGALASVECYDWSKKLTKEKGWTDNLNIYLATKEFADWLLNEAYQ